MVKVSVEAVVSILTLVGNGLVLAVLACNPGLRSTTNCFIGSLATADFLVGLVGVPSYIINSLVFNMTWYSALN